MKKQCKPQERTLAQFLSDATPPRYSGVRNVRSVEPWLKESARLKTVIEAAPPAPVPRQLARPPAF